MRRATLTGWIVRAVAALIVGLGTCMGVQAQTITWLGTLGGDWSQASGVSADGSVVVGWAEDASGWWHAFRWTADTGMQDLNVVYASLLGGSVLKEADAISPDGRYIVGYGYYAPTGREEAFLLDTVPEPSSLLVLGMGLVSLLRLRRQR